MNNIHRLITAATTARMTTLVSKPFADRPSPPSLLRSSCSRSSEALLGHGRHPSGDFFAAVV
jgi:hypothetical protein